MGTRLWARIVETVRAETLSKGEVTGVITVKVKRTGNMTR